jgi:hypothetical protein
MEMLLLSGILGVSGLIALLLDLAKVDVEPKPTGRKSPVGLEYRSHNPHAFSSPLALTQPQTFKLLDQMTAGLRHQPNYDRVINTAGFTLVVETVSTDDGDFLLAFVNGNAVQIITPAGNDIFFSEHEATEEERFIYRLQVAIAVKLDCPTDFIDFQRAYQVDKIILRPHEIRKLKALQSDAIAQSIQGILNADVAPLLTNESGNLSIQIARKGREFCHFSDFVHRDSNPETVSMALGVDTNSNLIDITLSGANLKHFVLGGVPRSGKSQMILSMIGSLVYRYSPSQFRFFAMDGKGGVTLGLLDGCEHLLAPVACDPLTAKTAVSLIKQMTDERYRLFRESRSQTIDEFNRKTDGEPLPYIGVFIDEFQDLFDFSSKQNSPLQTLQSLASLSPAAGIFFVWASQRIDAKLLHPQINNKCLGRVCLKVQKDVDSAFVLNGDTSGAYLLGKGDAIFSDGVDTRRLQGLYISEDELDAIFHPYGSITATDEPITNEAQKVLDSAIAYMTKCHGHVSVERFKQSWGKNLKPKINASQCEKVIEDLIRSKAIWLDTNGKTDKTRYLKLSKPVLVEDVKYG